VKQPRVLLDSCVLIEGLVAPWSASRGVLILGRAALFRFVLAELVIEETERALAGKLGGAYGGREHLRADLRLLLKRLKVERIPHVSQEEFRQARALIRHTNDAPVLAAALKALPDWVLTDNIAHFTAEVSARTGLRIATPEEFLRNAGRLFGGTGRTW
jgi:predicted nucleic acid-binding protein